MKMAEFKLQGSGGYVIADLNEEQAKKDKLFSLENDLQHLILDIGRSGRAWSRLQRVPKNDLDAQREPIRRQSWPNDRLSPLRRYLHKQVGRPWNKVYSELSRAFDKRSLRGFHLHEHVKDYVATHVVKTEKGYRGQLRWGEMRRFWRDELFVDEHGLLRKPREHELVPSRASIRKQFQQARQHLVRETKEGIYVKVDSFWWFLTPVPDRQVLDTCHDIHDYTDVRVALFDPGRNTYIWKRLGDLTWNTRRYDRDLWFWPKTKRQVGRAEVRRQKLES